MKFLRLDLLTLLISLFILGSCKNQSDVGLPVGSQEISGTLLAYDDLTVKTDTDNSVIASGIAKTPLSSFNDSRLGVTTSNVVTGLNLPGSAAYTVPTGTITTDSVIMELRYNDGFYGDSLNSRYRVNVYQLKEPVSNSQPYFSNRHWDHEAANLINTANAGPYNIRPKTAVKIINIVTGGKDTLFNARPHLRVALDPAFITNLLFKTSSAVGSNGAFQAATKGLYVTLQRNQASEIGGNIMLNLDSSRVRVYYRANNAGTIDTGVVALQFGSHTAEITHAYSAEVNAAMAGTASNDVFYLQGMAGLRAKVALPNLSTIFGTADLKTIAINRAELVVTPVAGTQVPFVAAPQLTLYRLDITKQRRQIPDANGSTSQGALDPRFFSTGVFGGNYISSLKEYHFLMTGYLQDLVRGRVVDYGTYLGAIDTVNRNNQVDISPTIQTAARVIAVGTNKTSPYRLKLNIIYTKNN